jgi:hypothetical protein
MLNLFCFSGVTPGLQEYQQNNKAASKQVAGNYSNSIS